MGKSQNFIEINGKKYDASSGMQVGGHTAVVRQTVDGFVGRSKTAVARAKHHARGQTTQKSHTLMRQAVKKPASAPRPHAPAHPSIEADVVMPHDLTAQRLKRAHKISQSPLISRFSLGGAAASVLKKVQPLKVEQHRPEHHVQKQTVHTAHTAALPAKPAAGKSASHSLVEQGLAKADSHLQAAHKVKKRGRMATKLGLSRRVATIGTSLVALLVLGAFFAYQNVPNFAMRIASARAGFNAEMPGYQPSGFSFKSPIKYTPGEVVVSFKSNTADNRSYTLTQRESNWNNDSLLANYVVGQDSQYQTFLEPERTVYTYANNNATWVNNGVWYQLESTADLTSDQIINIAESL